MTCPTDEALAAWSSGALDGAERDEVESHAAGCAACRGLAMALAGVVRGADRQGGSLGAEGAMIGRYRITGSVGHGAMGVVLRGHDPVLDREVAIKMVNSADVSPEAKARMLQEAQTLARIDHPNVVTVYDAGEVGDEVFVAMAYVSGPTLARWRAEGPHATELRVRVLQTAGAGLAAIHALGLVHRDVKPDNIVIHDGDGVVVDLGLARVQGAVGSGIAGTPEYLAPEVAAGRAATEASDQYSWWTVVHDTLVDTVLPVARRAAVDKAIARGRASDPDARYASMTEAVAALTTALAPRPRRWLLVAGVAIVAIAGGLVAWRAVATSTADDCSDAEPAAWLDRRAAITERLRGAGADADRVVAAIEKRAAATASLSGAACRAAKTGSADDRARALRQRLCVDDTWAQTEHIFAGLTDPAAHVVRAAVDELITVLPVDRCTGGSIPATPGPPPADKAREAVAVQAALREARLDPDRAPDHRLAKLRALETRVKALDYAPETTAWHIDMASALVGHGDSAAARRELDTAASIAEAAGDDDSRTRVVIDLLRDSYNAGSPDTATQEAAAEAAATRLGNPAFTAELRMSEGLARFTRGDAAGALAAMAEASKLFESIAIDANGQLVAIAQNLGGVQQTTGDLVAAQTTLDRGYELSRKRYGDDSPHTLEIRGARATNLLYREDFAAARPELVAVAAGLATRLGDAPETAQALGYICEVDLETKSEASRASCDRAAAAAGHAFPANHPQLAWSLTNVGRQRVEHDHADEAIAPLERALAVTEHAAVAPTDHPAAQAYLALALHELHRDPARAKALATEATRKLASVPSAKVVVQRLRDAFER